MVREVLAKRMEDVLKAQLVLISDIYTVQKKLYTNVLTRDWEQVNQRIEALDDLSQRFQIADKRLVQTMHEVIGSIPLDKAGTKIPDETVAQVIMKFSTPERANLSNLYKTLKEKVLLSKIENDVFNSYIEHARSLVTGVFDVVSHDRSGQTYTRTGVKADSDVSNVLVNRVY